MNQTNQNKGLIASFVWKNWYKLAFLGLLLYVFLQKDLSFSINLNAPFRSEEPKPTDKELNPKKESVGILSEKTTNSPILAKIPSVEKLGLPFFGTSEKSPEAFQQLTQMDDPTKMAYLERFAKVAINERKKFGVPSSIILANALLHSTAGQNDLAHNGNNHFALNCEVNWDGEHGNYGGQCYRHYTNSWSSFRDHSQYVTTGKFLNLRQLSATDYRSWAKALEQLDFSKEPDLGEKLVQIIEAYRLFELDTQ